MHNILKHNEIVFISIEQLIWEDDFVKSSNDSEFIGLHRIVRMGPIVPRRFLKLNWESQQSGSGVFASVFCASTHIFDWNSEN